MYFSELLWWEICTYFGNSSGHGNYCITSPRTVLRKNNVRLITNKIFWEYSKKPTPYTAMYCVHYSLLTRFEYKQWCKLTTSRGCSANLTNRKLYFSMQVKFFLSLSYYLQLDSFATYCSRIFLDNYSYSRHGWEEASIWLISWKKEILAVKMRNV